MAVTQDMAACLGARTHAIVRRFSWWLIPVPILFGAAFGSLFHKADPPTQPPSITLKATLITPEVEAGGVMLLHIEARDGQPERVCGGTVKREFWRKSKYQGRDIYFRWRPEYVGAAIYVPERNLKEYIVPIGTDPRMPLGEYMFYGETVNICGPRPEDTIVVKSFVPKVMIVAVGAARDNPDIIQ